MTLLGAMLVILAISACSDGDLSGASSASPDLVAAGEGAVVRVADGKYFFGSDPTPVPIADLEKRLIALRTSSADESVQFRVYNKTNQDRAFVHYAWASNVAAKVGFERVSAILFYTDDQSDSARAAWRHIPEEDVRAIGERIRREEAARARGEGGDTVPVRAPSGSNTD